MLRLDTTNYCATIVKINALQKLEGCDNLNGFRFMGMQSIVSSSIKVGDLGVLFSTETELSEEFCKLNNLHRDETLNSETVKGYIEKHRRVKAIKLRGHRSDCLWLPLASLSYTSYEFKEGDVFNSVNGLEICKKYEPPVKSGVNNQVGKKIVSEKNFPRHFDTENYFRVKGKYNENDYVVVTTKLHGTSARFGNVKVDRKKSFVERMLNKLGFKSQEQEYKSVYGTRNTIKIGEYTGFYESDVWGNINEEIKNLIPKDFIVYGEIVGRDGEKQIQKSYSYDVPKRETRLYVYRVSVMSHDGIQTDLSFEDMEMFCFDRGLTTVPILYKGLYGNFDEELFIDKEYSIGFFGTPKLSNEGTVDEGVCIRRGNRVTKLKSPAFLQYESKVLDSAEEVLS